MLTEVIRSKQATQPSIQGSPCVLSPWVKRPEIEFYHSALPNKVKNEWIYIVSTPPARIHSVGKNGSPDTVNRRGCTASNDNVMTEE